jgi:hypothetical protein
MKIELVYLAPYSLAGCPADVAVITLHSMYVQPDLAFQPGHLRWPPFQALVQALTDVYLTFTLPDR